MASKSLQFFLLIPIILSCKSKYSEIPMEKRFWDPNDYNIVIYSIEYLTPEGESFPTLSDLETAPIFRKLVDKENVSIVTGDTSLGLRHRTEFASEMFKEYGKLARVYYRMDRQDKFIYDQELVEILKFGLYVQKIYFNLGNEKIRQEADDPNVSRIKVILDSNEESLTNNYNNYLDLINNETAMGEVALNSFAEGITEYFPLTIKDFPNGDFKTMLKKVNDMLKKVTNEPVKKALSDLKILLEEKTSPKVSITP